MPLELSAGPRRRKIWSVLGGLIRAQSGRIKCNTDGIPLGGISIGQPWYRSYWDWDCIYMSRVGTTCGYMLFTCLMSWTPSCLGNVLRSGEWLRDISRVSVGLSREANAECAHTLASYDGDDNFDLFGGMPNHHGLKIICIMTCILFFLGTNCLSLCFFI